MKMCENNDGDGVVLSRLQPPTPSDASLKTKREKKRAWNVNKVFILAHSFFSEPKKVTMKVRCLGH